MSGTLDPQFGVVRILRPFTGFESIYGGNGARIPIMFTEGGVALDDQAANNKPGYSPSLVRGLTVPLGSRVSIWLPNIFADDRVSLTDNYNWTFQWRMRNVFDYRTSRQNYHFPTQSNGVSDTSSGTPSPRTIIPAANKTIVYTQAEPATGKALQHLRGEDIQSVYSPNILPFLPNGSFGQEQQGLLDPATFGASVACLPLYNLFDDMAWGDELLIGCWRSDTNKLNWDFTVYDNLFSKLFGSGDTNGPYPNIGVYVSTGVSP